MGKLTREKVVYLAQSARERGERPNFRGADLTSVNFRGTNLGGAYFNGANFSRANLCGANLSESDLSEATLRWAKLGGADLSKTDLRKADLREADLSQVDFREANLRQANLSQADLSQANLTGAKLYGARLYKTNFYEANLSQVDLSRRDFSGWDFRRVNLSGANLNQTILVGTDFSEANLSNCFIYGIAAWNLKLAGTNQANLIITPPDEPMITVDNLQVAQFIYLLLNNKEIRDVIDTITSKVVLILGRFTTERKAILDAIRDELRRHDYLPVLFDFEKPGSRDLTETISTLAHIARFIIADITEAKSIPQELQRIIPNLPSVPVQPIIASSDYEYALFEHFRHYPWVLKEHRYVNLDDLLPLLSEKVIAPAEAMLETQRRTT